MRTLLLISLLLATLALPRPPALAQPERPEFVQHTFVGGGFFLGIWSVTNQWMRVEISSDLEEWSELVNLITTRPQGGIYVDVAARDAERRFYRVVVPGTSVEEAKARWKSHAVSRYQFRARHWDHRTGLVTGTVMVANGTKTVTDVTICGQPASEFDPEAFPAIEELLDLLEEAAAAGALLVWSQYDAELGFPFRALINHPAENRLTEYEISELQVLPPEEGEY
jgi:hypothetical protein